MLFKDKNECCGCSACMNICPKSAIHMKSDKEGFLYPEIDTYICIECGLCKTVCAFQNGYDVSCNLEVPYVYAAKHKNEDIRMSSTSGGVFTAISDFILERKGIVYGAAFDTDMKVIHMKAGTVEEREKFKGSKYVQSDLKKVFKEIKYYLKQERYVLFSGTPCQVSGLKSYLVNIDINKLFLCDIVCHGTPSPLLWEEYIEFIEKKYKSNINKYKFRDKNFGWHGANITAEFKNKNKISNTTIARIYTNLYFSHVMTRPSCHNCKYNNLHRPSDITIADFWGIEKFIPDFDDNRGISLVLVNTFKGKELFDSIKIDLDYRESNTKDCLQPQLQYPSEVSMKRDKFWRDYYEKGFEYVAKKYAGYNLKSSAKSAIKLILKKVSWFKRGKM